LLWNLELYYYNIGCNNVLSLERERERATGSAFGEAVWSRGRTDEAQNVVIVIVIGGLAVWWSDHTYCGY
jgi:hypothetical protein